MILKTTDEVLRFIHEQARARASEHETLALITDVLEAQYPPLRDHVVAPRMLNLDELTPEGAAKLAATLSRKGRRIPKLAALLKRKRP